MPEVLLLDENGARQSLIFNEVRVRPFSKAMPTIVLALTPRHPRRRHAELFIEQRFERTYGTRIQRHYPLILSLQDSHGDVMAAVGVRLAEAGPLFLEQYLNDPIERVIEETDLPEAARAEIAEIGNLTSDGQGTSIFLFVALAEFLMRRNRKVAVATATSQLRRIFSLVGVKPHVIARADAAALSDRGVSWGRYYQTDPIVLAGSVTEAHCMLTALFTPTPDELSAKGAQDHRSAKFEAAEA